MCYSAQVWADYRDFVRRFGANLSICEFYELYVRRKNGARIKTTKAMDAAFIAGDNDDHRRIAALIAEYNAEQTAALEEEVFKQTKRLADAERTLQAKTTRKALNDQRIATNKIAWARGKLADLKRSALRDQDNRIFPGTWAPVMIVENGQRVIKPMRYGCRPAGKPAFYDKKYSGTYNARRDNLEGFWKGQFGHTHGIMVVNAFYENVSRHKVEVRELAPGEQDENVVLEFKPRPAHDMLVACLWSHWTGKGEDDLLSFAAITDEPPPEVAAAGHDRCIIPIKPKHLDAWLNPYPGNLEALYAILDDRDRPYYEHRMAA